MPGHREKISDCLGGRKGQPNLRAREAMKCWNLPPPVFRTLVSNMGSTPHCKDTDEVSVCLLLQKGTNTGIWLDRF